MSKENGGPAFPEYKPSFETGRMYPQEGMTLRDYFAAKAMQALIAKNEITNIWVLARDSYQAADALIKERSKDE